MSWDTAAPATGTWNEGAASIEVEQPSGFDGSSGNNGDGNDGYGGDAVDTGGGGGGFSGACFNCGGEGHSKADCTEPPKPRPCFNCGQEGHTKAECENPAVEREFDGKCRICDQAGHRALACPTAPPRLCNNCKEEGHTAFECKSARKIEYPGVDDIPAEEAWEQIRAAAEDRDIDDIKEAAQRYFKAAPDATYVQLEQGFRTQGFKVYLIAIEKELNITYTNMDLQGNLDKKFTVTWRLSDKASRPKEKDIWPASAEENLERLADAGIAVDRGVPKCSNCDELGHVSRACPSEKIENADRAVVKCYNCEELGHHTDEEGVRDCPNPRPDRFACRNCKQSGHSSKECPEPRSAEGVECKKCNEVGHFAKDCPQGGGGGGACHNCGEEGHRKGDCTNPRKLVCRNCDAEGHLGKDCDKPRDYSRIQCQNCKQMGHTKVRCKEPLVEEEAEGGYGGGGGGDYGGETAGAYGGGDVGGGEGFGGEALTTGGGGSRW